MCKRQAKLLSLMQPYIGQSLPPNQQTLRQQFLPPLLALCRQNPLVVWPAKIGAPQSECLSAATFRLLSNSSMALRDGVGTGGKAEFGKQFALLQEDQGSLLIICKLPLPSHEVTSQRLGVPPFCQRTFRPASLLSLLQL